MFEIEPFQHKHKRKQKWHFVLELFWHMYNFFSRFFPMIILKTMYQSVDVSIRRCVDVSMYRSVDVPSCRRSTHSSLTCHVLILLFCSVLVLPCYRVVVVLSVLFLSYSHVVVLTRWHFDVVSIVLILSCCIVPFSSCHIVVVLYILLLSCHRVVVLSFCSIPVLSRSNLVTIWFCPVVVLSRCHYLVFRVIVLSYCPVVVLSSYYVFFSCLLLVLSFCRIVVVVLSYCLIVVLSYCRIVALSCYRLVVFSSCRILVLSSFVCSNCSNTNRNWHASDISRSNRFDMQLVSSFFPKKQFKYVMTDANYSSRSNCSDANFCFLVFESVRLAMSFLVFPKITFEICHTQVIVRVQTVPTCNFFLIDNSKMSRHIYTYTHKLQSMLELFWRTICLLILFPIT